MSQKLYYLIELYGLDTPPKEIVCALVDDNQGFIGSVEDEHKLELCFSDAVSRDGALNKIQNFDADLDLISTEKQEENWNKIWEENFDPVVVGQFCTIKAPHHNINPSTTHTITINPEMSFGTGHHETTFMVIELMAALDFKDKSVLDFGCGTGILAILAEKLGASVVDALDNDEKCIRSALQNGERNKCKKLKTKLGGLYEMDSGYDIILANVNRAALCEAVTPFSSILNIPGSLIISGILKEDQNLINARYNNDFTLGDQKERGAWMAIRYNK